MNDLEKEIEALIASKQKIAKEARARRDATKIEEKNSINELSSLQTTEKSTLEKKEQLIPKNIDSNSKIITKADLISQFRLAVSGHKRWMANVQILTRIGDVETAKSSIPVNYTMCDFGAWYYGEGQVLNTCKEYRALEKPHQMIHDIYLRIFNLYNKKIVGWLFNPSTKQLRKRDQKAKELTQRLKYQSDILFDNLIILEENVRGYSTEHMNAINMI